MAKIFAPNKQYNDISAGVQFVQGIGETTNPHLIEWFKNHGYEVEQDELELNNEPEVPKKRNPRKKSE